MFRTIEASQARAAARTSLFTRQRALAAWVIGLVALAAMTGARGGEPGAGMATSDLPEVTVYKTAACGCCTKWVDHLLHSGLDVDVITVDETYSVRSRLGVPNELGSCHTAVAGGYWFEGHVPPDLMIQVIQQQPSGIVGLSVPGMPPGSPGMEAPNPITYQVVSVSEQGEMKVYATREGRKPAN